jgi:GNAT superfamily N-acetyltransferase
MGSELIADVAVLAARARTVPGLRLAAFSTANFVGLAECRVAVGLSDGETMSLAKAKGTIMATVRGDLGRIVPGASPSALWDGQVVGSLQVAERPVVGPSLHHPWVVSFFVHPEFRRRGVATALLAHAGARLRIAGFEQLGLRSKPGSRVALERLGFHDLEAGEPQA